MVSTGMGPANLDFYFDYLSPYAYFAWLQIQELCDAHKAELIIHPIVFGAVLEHCGQLGPAEIPSKKEFTFKHAYRYAANHSIPFDPPKFHPFNPIPALRLSLKEVSGAQQRQLITTLFHAAWGEGRDPGNPEELVTILNDADLAGEDLMARTKDPAIKERLKQETTSAIDRGVFGVPTMIYKYQLYWGNDQLEYVAQALDGKDVIDEAKVQEMLARPAGISRVKRS